MESAPARSITTVIVSGLFFAACSGGSSEANACKPFTVYAQNRFLADPEDPTSGYGAAGRAEPDMNSEKITSFAGHTVLTATGYVEVDTPAYPTNPEAVDGDHWFIVKTGDGTVYVSDAGVRAGPTENDPTGGRSSDLGPIVPLDPACKR